MVKISKIYTKTGDYGETQLIGGFKVSKSSLRILSLGALDELNAHLGICVATISNIKKNKKLVATLERIQQELFDIGAFVACLPNKIPSTVSPAPETWIKNLETAIDNITDSVPALNSFVLPGGGLICAQLHLARCVCRRAESNLVELIEEEKVERLRSCQIYLNRLSDLLFALTRKTSTSKELLWTPAHKRNYEY